MYHPTWTGGPVTRTVPLHGSFTTELVFGQPFNVGNNYDDYDPFLTREGRGSRGASVGKGWVKKKGWENLVHPTWLENPE